MSLDETKQFCMIFCITSERGAQEKITHERLKNMQAAFRFSIMRSIKRLTDIQSAL